MFGITGAVVSDTTTSNEPVSCSPPPSVTLQSTVVVPSPNVDPDAGTQVGVGAVTSSASVALAVQVTTAPAAEVASAEMSDGRTRVGGVFSLALRTKVTVGVPPSSAVGSLGVLGRNERFQVNV